MNLPKNYEPKEYEQDIYLLWEKSGAFKPELGGKSYFSMVMPPPNANADLHIGYALTAALEDIATRYHRMLGESTLLIPGADHAGFETWVVYEKKLNSEGKTRFDFSREELYSQVWDFVQQNKDKLTKQMRLLGISAEWEHFTFTLDDKVVKQAYATFKQMWHDKLIYRGERLVNYCTFHGTSFSDIEVVYRKSTGKLWYLNYPLTDGTGSIMVATTRPETLLGDTAVAVNPKDTRYAKFIGKTVRVPLVNREVPIISDPMVDREFGTGAVKITPAHNQNDFDVAIAHSLPMISVINTKGRMADTVPARYRELTVEEARKLIVKDLREAKLLDKEEPHVNRVGHCYKCDTVIQPLLREQWFVSMKPLAKKAIDKLKEGEIKFYPDAKLTQSIEYLEHIRDWNISRQIAWGIPIPAFQNVDEPEDWIYDERISEETIEVKGKTYRRDPDVFDTWFSSGQWPYVTLDFPENADFMQFYPLSLMETGGEILYQWVCRMIMLGVYITGKVPFKSVYIHGYVMAEDGSKMSKSVGNVINPAPVIEKYGSDALRMGLISGRSAGVNRGFDIRRVEEARNFGNKLWNVARFAEANIGDEFDRSRAHNAATSQDEWILHKIAEAESKIANYLDNYRFSEAFDTVYHLVWDDFADWYIETSKHELNKGVLAYSLEAILKLAHPFAPFITETIWQTLKWENDKLLIGSSWPKLAKVDKGRADNFERVIAVVNEIRFIKGILGLSTKFKLNFRGDEFMKTHSGLIKSLANLDSISEINLGSGLQLSNKNAWLDLDTKMMQRFFSELKKQLQFQEAVVKRFEQRLSNKSYVKNAPKQIVEETKSQLEEAETTLNEMRTQYEHFSSN